MRNDLDYYRRRAEEELARARDAAEPSAARAHYTLAGHYLDRVHGVDRGHKPLFEAQIPVAGSAVAKAT